MKLKELFKLISEEFSDSQIDSPQTEARFLLCEALNLSSAEFFLESEKLLEESQISLISEMSKRRINGEPLQYIIGSWDFMGRTYKVGRGVLIPRPETELLCEEVLKALEGKQRAVIYDLCTGSGCIGITLKCDCPDSEIYMIEKSEAAFSYLKHNVQELCSTSQGVNVIKGDILNLDTFYDLPPADIIVSNPPYIKSSEVPSLQKEVTFEPKMALDGGEDGLVFYRTIIKNISSILKKGGEVFFEIGEEQGQAVSSMFESIGFDSRVIKDYNNYDRIVKGRKTAYVS